MAKETAVTIAVGLGLVAYFIIIHLIRKLCQRYKIRVCRIGFLYLGDLSFSSENQEIKIDEISLDIIGRFCIQISGITVQINDFVTVESKHSEHPKKPIPMDKISKLLGLLDNFVTRILLGLFSIRIDSFLMKYSAIEVRIETLLLDIGKNYVPRTFYDSTFGPKAYPLEVSLILCNISASLDNNSLITSNSTNIVSFSVHSKVPVIYVLLDKFNIFGDKILLLAEHPALQKFKSKTKGQAVKKTESITEKLESIQPIFEILEHLNPKLYVRMQNTGGFLGLSTVYETKLPILAFSNIELIEIMAAGLKRCLKFEFKIKNFVLDLLDIPRDRTTSNILKIEGFETLLDLEIGNLTIDEIIKSWNFKLTLTSPSLVVEDSILIMILQSLPPVSRKLPETNPSSDNGDFVVNETLSRIACHANISNSIEIKNFNIFGRFQDFQNGYDPIVNFNFTSFKIDLSIPQNAMNDLQIECTVQLFDLMINYYIIPASKTDIPMERSPIFWLPSILFNGKIKPNQTTTVLCHISQILVDLLPLVKTTKVDSFSVAVRFQSILTIGSKLSVMEPQKTSKKTASAKIIDLELQLILDSIQLILVSESSPYHALEFGANNLKLNIYSIKKSAIISLGSFFGNTIANLGKGQTKESFMEFSSTSLNVSEKDSVIKAIGSSDKCKISVSLTQIYISILSALFSIKLATFFNTNNDKGKPPSTPLEISFQMPSLVFDLTLPENVPVSVRLDKFKLQGNVNNTLECKIESISGNVAISPENCFEFAKLNDITMEIIPPKKPKAVTIVLVSKTISITIPSDYPFYNIFDNAILLNKGIKVLLREFFGKDSKTKFENGCTTIEEDDFPHLILTFEELFANFHQREFEALIAHNYKHGYKLNLERVNLEKAFVKEAKSRNISFIDIERHVNNAKSVNDPAVAAWIKTLSFFSEQYTREVPKLKGDIPDLFSIYSTDFHIDVCIADMKGVPLEKVLHELDDTTPDDLFYDDLLPLQIKISMTSLLGKIKDFQIPMVDMPLVPGSRLETSGILIAADPTPASVSVSQIALPLNIHHTFINISKNANPLKIYLKTESQIVSNGGIYVCVGVGYEPHMADFISVFDSFSKPSVDPSPPIGWWDKLRQVLHGVNTLKISGSGGLIIRLVGSMVPDYDPRIHYGTNGIELALNSGAEIIFGEGNRDAFEMEIKCGELNISLPEASNNVKTSIARFTGGVSIKIFIDFLTKNLISGEGEIEPWKKHCEIGLRTVENCPDVNSWDAYSGFRSSSMSLSIDLRSPNQFYSGLTPPMNAIFLNSASIKNLQTLEAVYQSVLTNVPIKRGKLFNPDYKSQFKPKLGTTLRKISLKIQMQPVFMSSISELEDLTGGVGIRVKCEEMLISLIFNQYQLNTTTDEANKKPVTKWNSQSLNISFTDVEGRILEFDLPKKGNQSDKIDHWHFSDDLKYVSDVSDMKTIPFIWTPNITFFYAADRQEMIKTLKEKMKETWDIQIDLSSSRLAEIEEQMAQLLEEQNLMESRASVMFDSTEMTESDSLTNALTLLAEKKDAIKVHIVKCQVMKKEALDAQNDLFENNFIVHNVKILWNETVRNAVFKIVELQSKDFHVKYCSSNVAARVVAEVVKSLSSKKIASISQLNFNLPTLEKTDENIARKMLRDLLNDLKIGRNVIVDDKLNSEEDVGRGSEEIMGEFASGLDLAPEESKDMFIVELERRILFLNPQVSFEVVKNKRRSSIVVAAPTVEHKSVIILDSASADRVVYDAKDRADMIVKQNSVLLLSTAQFFAGVEQDKKTILDVWPLWAPVESLMDCKIPVLKLSRIVEQADVFYQREILNPFYINRSNTMKGFEIPDKFSIKFPRFQIELNPHQFATWMSVINDLLIYRDPDSGKRAERLEKVMLILQQAENLDAVKDRYLMLQERCRSLEAGLQYGIFDSDKIPEIRKNWIALRNELYVQMEALKNLRDHAEKRNSVRPSWKLNIKIDQLGWNMLNEDAIPFGQTSLAKIQINLVNNEDQSSINTIEISSLGIENLMPNAPYNDVLVVNSNEFELLDQKAIRLLWRENPPVGGIPVMDHFELNIVPILLQLTYEFGKQFMSYFFIESGDTKDSSKQSTFEKQYNYYNTSENREILQMQTRAKESRSFIYVKVPSIQITLCIKSSSQKKFYDLPTVNFQLPTLEYRNKTWTWYELVQAVKKDVIRAAFANAPNLVRERLFKKSIEDDILKHKKSSSLDEKTAKKGKDLKSQKIDLAEAHRIGRLLFGKFYIQD